MRFLGGSPREPPFVAIGEDAPGEHLRFVEIVADLLMRITLPALADQGKRVSEFLRFKNGYGCAVAMAYIFIENSFLFLLARVEQIVGFKLLPGFRQTEIVRPGEPEFFDNFVDELLPHAHLVVVFPQGERAPFIKCFAKLPNRLRLGIAWPPIVFAQAGFEVVVGEQAFRLPTLSDFRHSQKFGVVGNLSLRHGDFLHEAHPRRNPAAKSGHYRCDGDGGGRFRGAPTTTPGRVTPHSARKAFPSILLYVRKRRLFSNAKPASGDCRLQPSFTASRECVTPGIGSCALLVSHWDVATFNVEVRRRATISPALRDQRPKFEPPELVASLSKDPVPCQPPEFGAGPPIFPWLYCYGAAANPNPHRSHGTQSTLPN